MGKFKDWLRKNKLTSEVTQAPSALSGTPATESQPTVQNPYVINSVLTTKLQGLGPGLNNVLNRTEELVKGGQQWVQALYGAVAEYDNKQKQGPVQNQTGIR